MTEKNKTETPAWKRWLIGVGMIVCAVVGWLVAQFDGLESTTPDTQGAIEQVGQGIDYIKDGPKQ